MSAAARLVAALFAVVAMAAQAGGPLSICNNAARTPIKYGGTETINLNYDRGPLGARSKSEADAIVLSAVALWTNVSTASVTIGRGPDLPVDVTDLNYQTYIGTSTSTGGTSSDGLNPVVYDNDGSIIDLFFGLGAKNSTLGFAGSSFFLAPTCQNTEGRAVINGFRPTTDTTLSVTLAHEIGHLIGLDHTQLDSIQGIVANGNRPLMYPIASRNTITLHEDDEAAISALYPDATLPSVYGQISGTFVLADGVTPVRGANLWATEMTTNKVYSIVSDYLTQNTGFFKLFLPAGSYNLRAGTISRSFIGGSSVGPYSDDLTQSSFQPPLYSGTTPMANVTLGNASPTPFNISAGCAATLTFRIDGTGTVGGNCAAPGNFVLNVGKSGAGTGTVTSSPGGINCGATCSANFASASTVGLTATPTAGSIFAGWGGACSGTGSCSVVMNSPILVTANFLPPGSATEVFPPACQLPPGWTVPVTAQSGWSVVSNDKFDGVCSLKSNPIVDLQKAQIQFFGTFAAGNITFARRVSSEPGFDCFRFLIDDVQQSVGGTCNGMGGPGGIGASGTVAWAVVNVPVTSGAHTLTWSYEKDVDLFGGEDAAYIDAVVLPIASPGVLQFTASTLAVSEAIGNAVVSVSRTGGTAGAATVNFVTSGISATAGSDFTAQAGTLNWAAGDGGTKTITVPIVNDALIEANETFSVALSSPTGASIGSPATITVTITDNDAPIAPGAPTIGTATPGNAQALIAFTPPASDGGSPITSYTVTCGGLPGSGTASPISVLNLVNNTTYSCSVVATNGVGAGAPSGTVAVTPTLGAALVLTGVTSRKTHTGVGNFDIAISTAPLITGLVSVEPRAIGSGHTVLFKFNNTTTNGGSVSVVDGLGASVNATAATFGTDGVLVTIAALADNKRVTISLNGVNTNLNTSASMGFLIGDFNNSRAVNASDINGVKAHNGQATNLSNFKFDVNASGAINSSDISAVKARSGLVLP